MLRTILIPTLLLLALPAVAEDELEVKLQRIEARIAQLRAAARREQESRAAIDKRIADIDARIAAARKLDRTALGATKLEDLRAARAELEAARRRSRRGLKRDSLAAAAKVAALEKERTPVDLEALLRKSQKGDAAARVELTKIRSRIDRTIGVVQARQVPSFVQIRGGGFQVVNGMVIRQGGAPAQVGPQPAKPVKPKKKLPPEELVAATTSQSRRRLRSAPVLAPPIQTPTPGSVFLMKPSARSRR